MPIIFLHGWGQSQQVWFEQEEWLAQKKCLAKDNPLSDARFINLAGHGGRDDSDDALQDVMSQCPQEPFVLVGWSLGGMLAIRLAQHYTTRIKALVLVGSTPSFRQREDWLYGCDTPTFAAFEQGIASQASKIMSRFFALMFHDTNISRSDYNKIVCQAVDKNHPPSMLALQQGLQMLSDWDLRAQLAHIKQPTLVLHGQQDAVIPVQAGQYLAEHIPHADWLCFEDAGHAPFLTHPESFHEMLESWCQTH